MTTTLVSEQLLNEVLAIARRAGEAILDVYNAADDLQIQSKADDSPLTIADERSNQIIVDGLQALDASIPIVSEESPLPAFAERSQWSRFWLVDPLDGTKEFIKRNGEFTVNIALIENNAPVLGVVLAPAIATTYLGVVGIGAFREKGGAARESIRVRKLGDSSITVIGSRSHGAEALDALLADLRQRFPDVQMSNMGSSLKFCRVAEGAADLYPRLTPVCEWDAAAAHAVLRAAGGEVFNLDLQPLRYNTKDDLLVPQFIAAADLTVAWKELLKRG
jgi:3'(2'), 5'-bisphosphate nucleotidase